MAVSAQPSRSTSRKRSLLAAAAVTVGLTASVTLAPPVFASAKPNALPYCTAGTDGGRRGILRCVGASGHVRLITHCNLAPDADSGWLAKPAGNFSYDNTCWFNATSADAQVKA